MIRWAIGASLVFAGFAVGQPPQPPQPLRPLKYNNPGLVVDLGVGLWAWPVPCDADGDGDYDLIVSCPDKPSNGVWLFENTSGSTARNARPVFKPARRLSSTVHYVMPSYVDGKLRVLTPGIEYPDFVKSGLSKPVKLPVPATFYQPQGKQPKGPRVRHHQWRYVDYDGDGRLDLVIGIEDWSFYGWDDGYDSAGRWTQGPLHGFVFWRRNRGTTEIPDYADPVKIESAGKPIDVYGCPSPNFFDFDGDGDLDLLCGEFLDGFTYFQNVGTRNAPRYAEGIRLTADDGKPLRMDLQMIVPVAFDWDRDGDGDLIVGDEDGRVAFIENTGKRRGDGTPIFRPPFYFQQEADTLKCGALATPVGFDYDGDGDQDIVSGNTAGYVEWFENLSGPKVAEPIWSAPRRIQVDGKPFRIMAGTNGSIQGPAEAKWGYTCFSMADWDGDGLPDMVLNSILGDVVWIKNLGPRAAPRWDKPRPIRVDWGKAEAPPLKWGWRRPVGDALMTQWRTTPVAYDFTGDGRVDLAVLDTEGYPVLFERTPATDQPNLSAPKRVFQTAQGQPLRFNAGVAGRSGRRKWCITDWDGDGQWDILLNSRNADLLRGVGVQDGAWRFGPPTPLAEQNIEGHDVSPTVVDFDGDGIPDFLGGAEDGRLYYLRNPRSKERRLK